MKELPQYLFFQAQVVLGFYRPPPLALAHFALSGLGGLYLERAHIFWADFALSNSLMLLTVLWFLDTVFGVWQSLRDRIFSPGALVRGCGKWLLWVSILFVGYSLGRLVPTLSLVGSTMDTAVILTQSLYVVRGAARLLDNPIAEKLVKAFEGRIERRLQQVMEELAQTRDVADELREHNAKLEQLQDAGSHA